MKYKIRSLKGYRSGMQYVWGEGSLSGNSIQSCKALRGAEENSFEVENTRLFIRLQAFVLTLTTRKIAMQAIQVTSLRRILLPKPPSALLSSHLLYSSLGNQVPARENRRLCSKFHILCFQTYTIFKAQALLNIELGFIFA